MRVSGNGSKTILDLKGMQILIVEDEFLLASDLARQFSDAGATVLGPSNSVEHALEHVDAANAAILDVDLNGEDVFPIADELARRRVPFVFFTGHDEVDIPPRFHFARRVRKPASPSLLASELFGRMKPDGHVAALLPGLRIAARMLVYDPEKADILVEQTLRRAIGDIARQPRELTLEQWLHDLLDDIHSEGVG
jgi:CheY-like chemotaxis protein